MDDFIGYMAKPTASYHWWTMVSQDQSNQARSLKDEENDVSTSWGIITAPPSFERHNLVNTGIWFIYMKISGNIAKGMWSLQIWKLFVFWLNVLC